jgi:quinol monooxygenase YgiN
VILQRTSDFAISRGTLVPCWKIRFTAQEGEQRVREDAKQPVIRVSRGRFEPSKCAEVAGLLADSAALLVPAIGALEGLLYYHASVDENTNTVVNVSVWESEEAAKQMDKLAAMLAQRPILEAAGVTFDRNANYKPLWKIEKGWAYPGRD